MEGCCVTVGVVAVGDCVGEIVGVEAIVGDGVFVGVGVTVGVDVSEGEGVCEEVGEDCAYSVVPADDSATQYTFQSLDPK